MSTYFTALAIDEIREETSEAYSLFFTPTDPDWLSYLAGQYLTIKVDIDGVEYRRAYSLSSAPGQEDQLRISIKRVEGGIVSNYLIDQLQAGDTIEVMRPMGSFVIKPQVDRGRCYVLIGGGSGITPLMSILKTILHEEPLSVVYLWYGNRRYESIMFREELEDLSRTYGNRLFITHCLSQPPANWQGTEGRIDQEKVYEWISDLFMTDEHRKRYYLCGPTGMMDAAERAFDKHAVNPSDIHREWFAAPVPTEEQVADTYRTDSIEPSNPPAPMHEAQDILVRLDGETATISVAANQSILEAIIDAGMDPPYACQSGVCTSCMAKVTSGTVSMDEAMGLSESEQEEGYILTCQAHPLEPGVEIVFE